jgi:hypothetical protein
MTIAYILYRMVYLKIISELVLIIYIGKFYRYS